MAVKIRLKRMGKLRAPYYRIVVADSRTKRDGRVIEEIGKYHPTADPSIIEVDSARAQYWLGVGAQPSEQVTALLKLTGDWGTFKGEKGAKNQVKLAEPKEEFKPDTKKKPVLRPKSAKPVVEEKAHEETPAAEQPEVAVAEDAPVESAPAAEESAPEADAPAEAAPVDEAVSEEAPATEEPAAEEPAAEEPAATDEVPAEEASAEEPAAEVDEKPAD